MTDLLVYSVVIPVLPFQLERLKYSGVSGLVGWLLLSYVRVSFDLRVKTNPPTVPGIGHCHQSAGLVICLCIFRGKYFVLAQTDYLESHHTDRHAFRAVQQ
jgi:hypothetical protein